MRELSLPKWAKAIGPGKVEIDVSVCYPALLEELGVAEGQIDQYWLEVAFQCAKTDVQLAIAGTDMAPPAGGALVIFVTDPEKSEKGSKWAQKNHPKGRGAEAAARGKEARSHYARIRPGLTLF